MNQHLLFAIIGFLSIQSCVWVEPIGHVQPAPPITMEAGEAVQSISASKSIDHPGHGLAWSVQNRVRVEDWLDFGLQLNADKYRYSYGGGDLRLNRNIGPFGVFVLTGVGLCIVEDDGIPSSEAGTDYTGPPLRLTYLNSLTLEMHQAFVQCTHYNFQYTLNSHQDYNPHSVLELSIGGIIGDNFMLIPEVGVQYSLTERSEAPSPFIRFKGAYRVSIYNGLVP